LNQVVVPHDFDFETSQEYKFIFALGEMTPFQGKYLVQWYTDFPHAKAKARHSAFMDLNNPFVSDVTLPANTQRVYVKLTSPTGSSFVQEMVVNNTTSHTFYTGKKAGKVATYTCPSCSGCDNDNYVYDDNEKFDQAESYCVTSATKSNKNWEIKNAGAEVRVCTGGTVIIKDLYFKDGYGGGTVIIASGTTLEVQGEIKMKDPNSNIIVCDGGALTYNESENIDYFHGTLVNYGTVSLNAQGKTIKLGKDDPMTITNHSTMTITSTKNYDGLYLEDGSKIVNNQTLNINASAWISTTAEIENNCSVTHVGSGSYPSYVAGKITNSGYYKITGGLDLCYYGGNYNNSSWNINMRNNSFFEVDDMNFGTGSGQNQGFVRGPANPETAFLKITNSVTGGGGGRLTRRLDVCSPNMASDFPNAFIGSSVDFDCASYIPSSSCNPGNGTPPIQDADSDGVADNVDEYPNDATRAYNVYSPSQGNYKTFALEDTWPYQTDYDFNDLVVDYNIQSVTNAQNEIVEQFVTVVTKAMGGAANKGFAFNLSNLVPGDVSSVTGASNYPQSGDGDLNVSLGSNGTENSQATAVIIAYNSVKDHWGDAAEGSFQNVRSADAYQDPDTSVLTITYTTPYDGTINVEPFAFVGARSKEIHTKNTEPTDLMDDSFFGTADDDSNGSSTFYTTANGLPWAIVIEDGMETVEEKNDITTAYLKFASWASSGGTSDTDWNTGSGSAYRDGNKIYTK
jgi:LruC domain-containing protein